MANILVSGGGFAGVVAAESLAQRLGPEHRVTLVSRHREFAAFEQGQGAMHEVSAERVTQIQPE
jgi:NADH dehydrogenase FAD-containing subunit